MPTGKRAFLQGVAFWGVVLGLCYLGLRYALPCFLPLVLGAVMAAALHPAADCAGGGAGGTGPVRYW